MLDRKYFKDFSKGATVEQMIETLKQYPPKAKFTVLGDPRFYIHMESDGSEVIVDDSPVSDIYVEAIHNDELKDNLRNVIKGTGVPKEMIMNSDDEMDSICEDIAKICELSIKKKWWE